MQSSSACVLALSLALLSLTSCDDRQYFRINGQDEAEEIVWRKMYKRTDAPPTVDWMFYDELKCDNGKAIYISKTSCADGLYIDSGFVMVAKPLGKRISLTAYAHELMHVKLKRETGLPNSLHDAPEFQYISTCGGKPANCGLVEQAEDELWKAGL